MRARIVASAPANAPPDRAFRLRSLVLLPALVATAAAMQAPTALARSSEVQWEGRAERYQAARLAPEADDDDEARPRRRSRGASLRRRGHQPARLARGRGVGAKAARGATRKAATAKATPRARRAALPLAASPPPAALVPLDQRSLVASHPLLPDAAPPATDHPPQESPPPFALAAPRCRGAHPSGFALAVASLDRRFAATEPAMVDGAWPQCRGARTPQSTWQLASLGPGVPAPDPAAAPSLAGGPIHWRASAACLASPLRAILQLVAANFGPVTVNSTCRSPRHNARVGGAPRSYHLTGQAADFRVRGQHGAVLAFLLRQRTVGGFKHYGSGVFHIDTGPRRTWGARHARAGRRA